MFLHEIYRRVRVCTAMIRDLFRFRDLGMLESLKRFVVSISWSRTFADQKAKSCSIKEMI